MIILENYVPENHLLRKVDHSIDFRFVYELVVLSVCTDRLTQCRTIEETKVYLAARWFHRLWR